MDERMKAKRSLDIDTVAIDPAELKELVARSRRSNVIVRGAPTVRVDLDDRPTTPMQPLQRALARGSSTRMESLSHEESGAPGVSAAQPRGPGRARLRREKIEATKVLGSIILLTERKR